MPRTLALSAGASVPSLSPGDTLLLDGGGYANLHFDGVKGEPDAPITIRAVQALSAKVTGAEFGIRIEGCQHVVFDGFDVTAKGHGLKATDSQFLTFRNQRWHDCGVEGAIFGGCDDCTVEDSESFGNGRGYAEYPPEKGHGLYVSWGSKRPEVRRFHSHDNGGCGIQLNGTPEISGIIEAPLIEDCVLTHNGAGGAAGMNIMRTRGGSIRNVLLAWWEWSEEQDEAGGVACYSDNSDFAVEGLTFDGVTIYFPPPRGRYGMQFLDGSKGNIVRNSIVLCGRGPAMDGDPRAVERYTSRFDTSERAGQFLVAPASGDWTSRLPGMGFRDWRQEPAPVPTPTPPVDPLAAVRSALGELDEPLAALYHHTANAKPKTLRAVLRADQEALVAGVGKAKAAAAK